MNFGFLRISKHCTQGFQSPGMSSFFMWWLFPHVSRNMLGLVYTLCLLYIPVVYHHNCSFSWSCPVPWTSHHLLWCSSGSHPLFLCQGLTIFSFATLEVWLYLCRWNWLLMRSLLELWCGLLTQVTSMGNVPMARVAPLPTLLCELLSVPSIILWEMFLVLKFHLQVV